MLAWCSSNLSAQVLAQSADSESKAAAAALHARKLALLEELETVEEGIAASKGYTLTCNKRGCTDHYRKYASCQCSPQCKKYSNCCSDYSELCEKSENDEAGEEAEDGLVEDASSYNESRPCLCGFDIDRTLTAGQREKCPSACHQTEENIWDDAYGGGRFKLGEVGALSIAKTTCSNCYTAIVSRGQAGGHNSKMRKYILDNIIQTDATKELIASGKIKADWTDWGVKCKRSVDTPFVVKSPNECKKYALEGVRQLYEKAGVKIEKRDVFFFDDHSSNIPAFKNFGMNAFEIGCKSHSHSHTSRCGATESEIRMKHKASGYEMCSHYG